MTEKPEDKAQKLELRWPFEDDLPLLYANQFAVLETANEVILVFGNYFPLALQKPDVVKQLSSKSTIKPLAKIAVSKAGFKALTDMLNKRMKNQDQPEIPGGEEN